MTQERFPDSKADLRAFSFEVTTGHFILASMHNKQLQRNRKERRKTARQTEKRKKEKRKKERKKERKKTERNKQTNKGNVHATKQQRYHKSSNNSNNNSSSKTGTHRVVRSHLSCARGQPYKTDRLYQDYSATARDDHRIHHIHTEFWQCQPVAVNPAAMRLLVWRFMYLTIATC